MVSVNRNGGSWTRFKPFSAAILYFRQGRVVEDDVAKVFDGAPVVNDGLPNMHEFGGLLAEDMDRQQLEGQLRLGLGERRAVIASHSVGARGTFKRTSKPKEALALKTEITHSGLDDDDAAFAERVRLNQLRAALKGR